MKPRTVRRPWGRMRVWEGGREDGSAPTLLAIHGLGGSGRYWDGLEDLAGSRFRIVAPDLAGFGRSDKPRDAAYDRGFHLTDLDALAEREGGRIVVIGHSLGGVLAQLWAGRRPDLVAALSLNAAPYPEPRPSWDPRHWRGARRLLPAAVAGLARLSWPLLSVPAQVLSAYPGAVVRDYGRQTMKSRSWTLWTLWSDPTLEADVRAAASAIPGNTPILLLHADDDRSVKVASMDRWSEALKSATVRRLPEGGHQFLLHARFAPLGGWLDGLAVGDHR